MQSNPCTARFLRAFKIDPVSGERPITSDFINNGAASIRFNNVVTKNQSGCTRNVRQYPMCHSNSYVPYGFGEAFIVRVLNGNNTTVLGFHKTGIQIAVGARSIAQTVQALHLIRQLMSHFKLCEDSAIHNLKLENSVVVVDSPTEHGLDLARAHSQNRDQWMYDPGNFPGARAEVQTTGVVIVMRIFENHIVVMGMIRMKDIKEAEANARQLFIDYETKVPQPAPGNRFRTRIMQYAELAKNTPLSKSILAHPTFK